CLGRSLAARRFSCGLHCRSRSGFFFSSRRRHTRFSRDWSSDVCSSDLRVRFAKKISTLNPCFPKFWRCSHVAKLTILKTRILGGLACSCHCTAKTASSSAQEITLIFYLDTLCGG